MPWRLSFSCGKALQKTCIVTWPGEEENKEAAQKALKAQANANFDAVMGKRGVLQLHQAESGRLMLPMTEYESETSQSRIQKGDGELGELAFACVPLADVAPDTAGIIPVTSQ